MPSIEPERFLEARKLGRKYLNYMISNQTEKANKVKEELDSKGLYEFAFPKAPIVLQEEYTDPYPTSSLEVTDLGRQVLSGTVKLEKPLKSKKAYLILSGMPEVSSIPFSELKTKLRLSKPVLEDNLAELVYRRLVDRI